jgi:hypothetical protein
LSKVLLGDKGEQEQQGDCKWVSVTNADNVYGSDVVRSVREAEADEAGETAPDMVIAPLDSRNLASDGENQQLFAPTHDHISFYFISSHLISSHLIPSHHPIPSHSPLHSFIHSFIHSFNYTHTRIEYDFRGERARKSWTERCIGFESALQLSHLAYTVQPTAFSTKVLAFWKK